MAKAPTPRRGGGWTDKEWADYIRSGYPDQPPMPRPMTGGWKRGGKAK